MTTNISKFELAEKSFKAVLDADIHLDNKASRILSAIAFLTVAAVSIFAKAYSPEIAEKGIQILGYDLAVLSFSAYILFVLLGSGLYLFALGPSLNIPSWLRSRGNATREDENQVRSLLFFDSISALPEETWSKHWHNKSSEEIQKQMLGNLIKESYLIAQKTKNKVDTMSLGSIFFRIAIACLIPLVTSFLHASNRLIWIYICIGLFFLFFIYTIAYWKTWNNIAQGKSSFIFWGIVTISSLIMTIILVYNHP